MNLQRSLSLVCVLFVALSGRLYADESTDKKVQGVRKAIDVCIEFLEKRDFEGFIDKATHPSIAKDIKKSDETLKKCIDGHRRHVAEILAAMKAAKNMEPTFRESAIPNDEKAYFLFDKSILKDREVMVMKFQSRNGIWYFLD